MNSSNSTNNDKLSSSTILHLAVYVFMLIVILATASLIALQFDLREVYFNERLIYSSIMVASVAFAAWIMASEMLYLLALDTYPYISWQDELL